MEELVRHRILHGADEAFEFTHDRIREVAYGDLHAPRRAMIHRRVAEPLELLYAGELDAHALALGTHYREGQVWPKAVHHLAQAGMQAWLRYAQRDAVVCYEYALSALAHQPESRETREQQTDLRFRLAHLLYGMGEFERAMTCFRDAERLGLDLGDHGRLGEIYAGMAYLLGSEGASADPPRRRFMSRWRDIRAQGTAGRVESLRDGGSERGSPRPPASRPCPSVGAGRPPTRRAPNGRAPNGLTWRGNRTQSAVRSRHTTTQKEQPRWPDVSRGRSRSSRAAAAASGAPARSGSRRRERTSVSPISI